MKTINYTLTLLISFSAIPTLASDGGSYNAERKAEFSEATNAIQEGPELLFDTPKEYEQYAAQKSDNTLNRALRLQACKSVQQKLKYETFLEKDLVKTISWMRRLPLQVQNLIFKKLPKQWYVEQVLSENEKLVGCLLTTPYNQLISGHQDGSIKIRDIKQNKLLYTLNGHTNYISALQLTADNRLISGSGDTTIKIWDLNARVCTHTFHDHTAKISALKLINDHEFISGSFDKTVKKWDLKTLSCIRTAYIGYKVMNIEIAPNQCVINLPSWKHSVLNLDTLRFLREIPASILSITPNFIQIKVSPLDNLIEVTNLSLECQNLPLYKRLQSIRDTNGCIGSFISTSDNEFVALGTCMLVYTIKPIELIQKISGDFRSVAITPDNSMITSSINPDNNTESSPKCSTIKVWKKGPSAEEQAYRAAEKKPQKSRCIIQ